jgi:histidinol-phosphate aminotransferase
VGCGADELIDLLMRCVLEPGDKIVDCPPTFTMYVFDAAVNAAEVVTVPRLSGFRIDVDGENKNFIMSSLFFQFLLNDYSPK